MSKELEKEFTKVIASVTKDVTESVVRDSALASVKELNESLQTLQKDSPKLVTDIEKAGNIYTKVSHEAMENMQNFSDFISKWQEQQSKILEEISKRNDIIFSWLKQSEKRRIEDIKTLQKSTNDALDKQHAELQKILRGLETRGQQIIAIDKQIESNHQELMKSQKYWYEDISSKVTTLKVLTSVNFLVLAALAGYTLKGLIGR